MNKLKILLLLIVLPLTCLSQKDDPNVDSISAPPKTFLMVEKTAEFPGGIGKFYKYAMKNLRYPESAKRNGVEGKVYVMFVIDQDGSIDDKTVRALTPEEIGNFAVKTNVNLDAGCQEEAVRILRECPDWKPASIKKQPVRQRMVIPIPFNL